MMSQGKNSKKVGLGILGTGGMANMHARRFTELRGCELVAACDVDERRVGEFARKYQIARCYTKAEELLADAAVDAVAIVTPDATHAPLSLAAIKAGKHVLCEKPLALHYADARKMLAAAEKAGIVHMVNLSYRDWPAIQAIAALVAQGKLGDLRHVEASYLQAWLVSKCWGDWRTSPGWLWRLSRKHGSNGVLGDVGVHIVDFASYPAGPISKVYCQLKTYPKAEGNRVGEYVLDANDSAVLNVTFANGAIGTIHTTRWCGGHANRLFLRIAGTLGTVEFDSDLGTDAFRICAGKALDSNTWKTVKAKSTPTNYRRFIESIRLGRRERPTFVEGAAAQKVLDAAIRSAQEDRPVKV
jgi:predicted dehydrogenase